MTDKEREVIQWAFNFTHSIVAGDYRLPMPMNYTMNNLQDAVHDLAKERGISSIEDGCTDSYLSFHKEYWDGVKAKLGERL